MFVQCFHFFTVTFLCFLCTLFYFTFITTHIYGAAHQRASLQRLPHDVEELFGRLGQLEELGNSSCEVLHGFQSVAPFQCLIRPVQPEREVNHSVQCADMYVLRGFDFSQRLQPICETWGRRSCVPSYCPYTAKNIHLNKTFSSKNLFHLK